MHRVWRWFFWVECCAACTAPLAGPPTSECPARRWPNGEKKFIFIHHPSKQPKVIWLKKFRNLILLQGSGGLIIEKEVAPEVSLLFCNCITKFLFDSQWNPKASRWPSTEILWGKNSYRKYGLGLKDEWFLSSKRNEHGPFQRAANFHLQSSRFSYWPENQAFLVASFFICSQRFFLLWFVKSPLQNNICRRDEGWLLIWFPIGSLIKLITSYI